MKRKIISGLVSLSIVVSLTTGVAFAYEAEGGISYENAPCAVETFDDECAINPNPRNPTPPHPW